MNPNDYIGRPLIEVFTEFRSVVPLMDYAKVEGDEFLKLPEQGVYFQAAESGVLIAYRVYYKPTNEYFSAAPDTKAACFGIAVVDDAVELFGPPSRDIPSVRIPGVPPTLPGHEFRADSNKLVSIFYSLNEIVYIHVKVTG